LLIDYRHRRVLKVLPVVAVAVVGTVAGAREGLAEIPREIVKRAFKEKLIKALKEIVRAVNNLKLLLKGTFNYRYSYWNLKI